MSGKIKTTIIGISGSLRRNSFNSALLREAAALAPDGAEIAIHSIAEVPLYNGDDEVANGLPPAVQSLKEAIAASQGLLLCSPEYNNSIPGVVKNAIDWLSRTPEGQKPTLRDLPVALAGTSPGNFGTLLGQNAWLPVLRTVGAQLWSGRLIVPGASRAFDADGKLTDEATQLRLQKFINGFVENITSGS